MTATGTDTEPSASSPVRQRTGDAVSTASAGAVLPWLPDSLRRHSRRGLGFVVPALIILAWHTATATGFISPRILPEPLSVAEAALRFFTLSDRVVMQGVVPFAGAGWQHLSASLARWLSAYVLAVGVGLTVGFGIGVSRLVASLLDPVVQALRAIPIFAWLPLALVWFGLGEGAARYLVFVGAVFPIIIATADSVSRVPKSYVETARMLGVARRRLARKVYLPASAPGIVTGLRLGLTLGWMSVIVGELTGTRFGIGAMMFASRESGRLDQVIVGMACFAIVGLFADFLLRRIMRPVVRWSDA